MCAYTTAARQLTTGPQKPRADGAGTREPEQESSSNWMEIQDGELCVGGKLVAGLACTDPPVQRAGWDAP